MGRRLRAAVNPLSTALSRCCRWAVRHIQAASGPTANQRRSLRRMTMRAAITPSEEEMQARRAAIDELMASDAPDDDG